MKKKFYCLLILFLIFIPSLFAQETHKVKIVRKKQYFGAARKMKLRVNDQEIKLKRKAIYEFDARDNIILGSNHLLYRKNILETHITKDTTIYLKYGFSLFRLKPKVVTG
ncbi:MAG: hypothetical protein K0R65_983 [Crocinitomicaceae bacterium]|jgi:hypothetical protein|nr:hypothetical protein [Crocinitomicaceae bacterium]